MLTVELDSIDQSSLGVDNKNVFNLKHKQIYPDNYNMTEEDYEQKLREAFEKAERDKNSKK